MQCHRGFQAFLRGNVLIPVRGDIAESVDEFDVVKQALANRVGKRRFMNHRRQAFFIRVFQRQIIGEQPTQRQLQRAAGINRSRARIAQGIMFHLVRIAV